MRFFGIIFLNNKNWSTSYKSSLTLKNIYIKHKIFYKVQLKRKWSYDSMTVLEGKTINVLRYIVRNQFVWLCIIPQKFVSRHKVALQPCGIQTNRFDTLLYSSFGAWRTMSFEKFFDFQSGFLWCEVFCCGFH